MVEQNVKSALEMADEAIALESGRLVLQPPRSLRSLPPEGARQYLRTAGRY